MDAQVTFVGLMEAPGRPAIPLFNTADGHTLSEAGLRKRGIVVPAAHLRADLLDLAARHCESAAQCARANDLPGQVQHLGQVRAIFGILP